MGRMYNAVRVGADAGCSRGLETGMTARLGWLRPVAPSVIARLTGAPWVECGVVVRWWRRRRYGLARQTAAAEQARMQAAAAAAAL